MREILFRGKLTSTGEWSEGNLVIDKRGVCIITPDETPIGKYGQVIPETVGQYIGLTDKSGKKIFEGDILQYFDNEIQVVEWYEEFSNLMLHTYGEEEHKKGRNVVKEKFDGWNWLHDYPLDEMPIIGNIHDNPELITQEA